MHFSDGYLRGYLTSLLEDYFSHRGQSVTGDLCRIYKSCSLKKLLPFHCIISAFPTKSLICWRVSSELHFEGRER